MSDTALTHEKYLAKTGRPCEVCRHPDRSAIEAALRRRRPLGEVANRFVLSASSLGRHRRKHLDEGANAQEVKPSSSSLDEFEEWCEKNKFETPQDVLAYCKFLVFRLQKIADSAESNLDLRTAVSALSVMTKQMENLFAKTSGLLTEATVIGSTGNLAVVLRGMTEQQLRDFLLSGTEKLRS